MPGPLFYGGLSFGANALSRFFSKRSERQMLDRLRKLQLAALSPWENKLRAYELAPTAAEGSMMGSSAEQALEQVAASGVGGGTFTGPAVLQAIAPIQAQRERNLLDEAFRLSQAKSSIYAGTSTPGYGSAFGGLMGDVSEFGSAEFGRIMQMRQLEDLLRKYPQLLSVLGGLGGK